MMVACCSVGCSKNNEEINATINLVTEYNGDEIDLCNSSVREYLDEEDENEQSDIIYKYSSLNYTGQSNVFIWDSDKSTEYIVYISDNKEMENARTYKTEDIRLDNVVPLVPGKTYYWKVEGNLEGSTSKIDSFKTKDAPVRFITTDSIVNVRDIGGWKAGDKTVRYEKIYRGGRTNTYGENECSEEDKKLFSEDLGIRTEIDLRSDNDDYGQSTSVFGAGVSYYQYSMGSYSYIVPGFYLKNPTRKYDSNSPISIREIFRILGDENNYPIYFHCNAGADRTGTLAFLINGVLGVSYEDLTRDFELTSFTSAGNRWRSSIDELDHSFGKSGIMKNDDENYIGWDYFYNQIMKKYGQDGDLQKAVEKYLVKVCNVDENNIETLKKMMLE